MKSIFILLLFFTLCHVPAPLLARKGVEHQPSPCVIVVFGATGDLTARKLFPAFYHLLNNGYLSSQVAIVGVGRRAHTHASFSQIMEHAVEQSSRAQTHNLAWQHFKKHIFYHQAEFEDDQRYQDLHKLLNKIDEDFGTQGNRLYYLATQPSFFPLILEKLWKHQLIYSSHDSHRWSKVIIEKPFGQDLETAMQLQEKITQFLDEQQVYRIDHYLGKEGVQNLLALRFENGMFEPIWNHRYIDHVQITLSETIGIESRAAFWEETGCLRDLFQNHLLQLLAIVAMDLPQDRHPASLHAEKIKVLRAIRSLPSKQIESVCVRGQYGSGKVGGKEVPGYREEKGVSRASVADTFVAAKLFIDHPRWENVPFYIRGGKRLAKQTTEIAMVFKKNPLSLSQEPNALFIRIQPQAGVFLKMIGKSPGLQQQVMPFVFGYQQGQVFQTPACEAYERLIYDCINGEPYLFVQAEEHLAAWRVLAPVLKYWKTHPPSFPNYAAGTWGPQAADQMLAEQGHQWLLLEEEISPFLPLKKDGSRL